MSPRDRSHEFETPEGFGANVRRLRKERGYSVYVFADITGISVGYISQLERGQRDVSLAMIGAIAKGLDLRMRDLFGPPAGIPESAIEAAELFEAASPEMRAVIWDVMRYEPPEKRKRKTPKEEPPKEGPSAEMGKVIPFRRRLTEEPEPDEAENKETKT